MDKRPKRRKDKYNPYTLSTDNQKYYVSFKDINGNIQKTEVDKSVFDAFDSFGSLSIVGVIRKMK